MACWLTLDHAVALARDGHLESTWQEQWQRERDRINEWVESHCWSDAKQVYTFYPSSDKLDAAVTLMHAYGARINWPRMLETYAAIHHELGHGGAMLYRYSGVEKEESTFIACSFWRVEALANLDDRDEANAAMTEIFDNLCDNGNIKTFNEMFDVNTGL